MRPLFGPVPSGGEQAVVLVLTVVLFGLAALFWGSVARRWWGALKRMPSAYRQGRDANADVRNDDREE